MVVSDDLWTWESPLRLERFDQTRADTGTVAFRAWGYLASIARYSASVASIRGTGMLVPTL